MLYIISHQIRLFESGATDKSSPVSAVVGGDSLRTDLPKLYDTSRNMAAVL